MMRTLRMSVLVSCLAGAAFAAESAGEPLRVALLDFENQASAPADAALVGGVTPAAVADKGVAALGGALANEAAFVLIDRREFIAQIAAPAPAGAGRPATPSFLKAAQAVRADAVLRGSLLSYSPGTETVNQGGFKTEFQTLALRVAIQALDTRDGAVIAMVEGAATRSFRQSESHRTSLGEDDVVRLLQDAVAKAVPALQARLQQRRAQQDARPKVKLTVRAGEADPALVEIDGLLIGSTPLEGFELYAGDHTITVGKAGYRDVSKQLLIRADTAIEVPLFRAELSAEELKQVLEKARLNVVAGSGVEPAWIIQTLDSTP